LNKNRYIGAMRIILISSLFITFLSFNSYSQNSISISDLKNGHYLRDSSPIYELPFLPKKRVLLIQGYQSIFSHKGEYASDFKVSSGSKIFAAREGIVVKTKADSKIGGLGRKFLAKGNHIIIMHNDSTCAAYWHLKYDGVNVEVGDTIQIGELIGYSGNTGYSAFPHLHFEVFKLNEGRHVSLPARFKTSKGVIYLKPLRKYRRQK
jgi:murein DD-endopeptidase MepM/ murein hydrolase activator NlpD